MTALPTIELDPPTISMTFGVNDSPLAGRDGTHVSNFYIEFNGASIIFTFFCANLRPETEKIKELCTLLVAA